MTRVELLKVLVEDYNEDISTIKSLTKEELEELLEEQKRREEPVWIHEVFS